MAFSTPAQVGRETAASCAMDEAATWYLLPLCEVIPLQLFACFLSVQGGINVGQPRNLLKAVVEE